MKKTTMANDLSPELQENLNRIKDNLLISLVKREGGRVEIPLAEVDAANDLMTMEVDGKAFVLETKARN